MTELDTNYVAPLDTVNPIIIPFENTSIIEKKGIISLGPSLDRFIWANLYLDTVSVKILPTSAISHIYQIRDFSYQCIVNLNPLNNVRHLNKFLEAVNTKLPQHGYFIGCVETKNQRKKRIISRHRALLSYPLYFADFLFHRVFSKLKLTKRAYFSLTKGNNRTLTLSETLGRLICCGYEIVDQREINGHIWFIAKKHESPSYDMEPTYGPICRIQRVGMHGKIINVIKIRTMHPYSEYLQAYLFKQNGSSDGDKINGDFRVTHWGKFMRRLWIDEIPMLYNLFKGDIKMVGVRPLSRQKFKIYPEWLQKKRIKTKPGLIPPFYADCPETPEEFFETENRYIDAYLKNPWKTDTVYFFRAMYNIFFKKVRSG